MEKNVAISILQDVQNSLMDDNWKEKSLKTIELYIKGLEIATNEKFKKMVKIHCKYAEKYGDNHQKMMRCKKFTIKNFNIL